jgi:capsular exopolysaccharide synthesis family protein
MANIVPHNDQNSLPPAHRFSMSQSPNENEPAYQLEETLDLREILGVLRRHKLLVGVITLLVVGVAMVLAFRQAPQYRASAVIRLKNERQALTGSIQNDAMDQVVGKAVDPLLSQLQVLRSRSNAREVVKRTGMRLHSTTPGFSGALVENVSIAPTVGNDSVSLRFGTEGYAIEKDGTEARAFYGRQASLAGITLTVTKRPAVRHAQLVVVGEEAAAQHLLDNLTTRALDKTDVVQVEFTHSDPHVAQRVANAAVGVFQTANASESQQQSRRRRLFLEEQLGKTDSVLAVAQLQLSDFRRREQVYSSRDKFAAQQTSMIELDVRREELVSDRRVFASLLNSLARSDNRNLRTFVSAPGIAGNPVISQLYTQLLQYQTARDSAMAGPWGSAAQNPDVQRLNTLITNTERRLIDAVQSHVGALEARIRSLDEMKARNTVEIQGLPEKEAEEMRLMQQVETANKLADQLREEYQKARIAEAVEIGQVEVVDFAGLPVTPIGSGRGLKITLGLLIGLMLGGGAAFLREHLDTKVRRRDELEPLLKIPSLAVIPRIAMNGKAAVPRLRLPLRADNGNAVERPLERLVTIVEGRSSGAEAYRSLRTNLLFSQTALTTRRVLVTSAMAAEGKTTTASNLAVTFAQQGKSVLIIDGDLRKARLHRVFGITREPGLVDVIAGFASIDESIRPSGVQNLSVLAAGTLPPNPSELLGSPRMREVLDAASERYDLVLIDAPPVLVAGDASILSVLVDGTVMVLRAGQTDRGAALAAVQQLKSVGATMLGSVLNDPDAKVASYEGYYYYAYNYYGEEEEAPAK